MAPLSSVGHDEHDVDVSLAEQRLRCLAHGNVEGRPVADLLDIQDAPAPVVPHLLVHVGLREVPHQAGQALLLLERIRWRLTIQGPLDDFLEDDGRNLAGRWGVGDGGRMIRIVGGFGVNLGPGVTRCSREEGSDGSKIFI